MTAHAEHSRGSPPAPPPGAPQEPDAALSRQPSPDAFPDAPRGATRLLLTRTGAAALAGLVPCVALALAWGWAGAAGIAVLLLVAFLVAFAVVLRPVRFEVRVVTDQSRIIVGRVSIAHLEVTGGPRGSSAAVVDVPVGDLSASFLVPRLGPGERWREPFLIPTSRRQVLTLGPATAVRSDALGLLSRDTVLSGKEEIFVHPPTTWPGYDATGLLRDLEGVESSSLSVSDVSFHALRDYLPGDDRRHVHWRSTARTGKLVVRQFEETRRSEHVIVVDPRLAAYARPEDAELALAIGSSFAVDVLLHDRQGALWCGGQVMPMGSPMRLLDAVTEVTLMTEGGDSLADQVHAAARTTPQASAVTLVTGDEADPQEVLRAVDAVPLSAVPLVIRATATGRVERRQLGRAAMFSCSELAQLRRIVAVVSA